MARGARWMLYLATVGVVLAFGKLHAARVGYYDITDSGRLPWLIVYIAVLLLAAYGAGLPDQAGARGSRSALPAALAATGGAAVVVSVVQLLDGAAHLPRFVVFAAAAVLVPTYAALALVASGGRERQEGRERVVVVASEDDAIALLDEMRRAPERPASIVWALTPNEARGDRPADISLLEAARDTGASVVVLSHDAQGDPEVVAQAGELHAAGVRVRTLSGFYDEWLGKLPLGELERVSLMFDIRELHGSYYARIKRFADVVVALAALPLLVVAVPPTWLANLKGNRGPLFFAQPRTGKNGRTFQILKFRTMIPAPENFGEWTADDDPRITRVGKWLRRTHLDELPQVINILRGDLSLVGPRPEQPHYVEDLVEKIPFYALRHSVRPGLTGWAQVKYAYGASDLDAREKLQYEFFYLRHQSLSFDARVMVRTIRSVLGRLGR
ncbi:MAG TPA: sugar transferase [Acidimicrobiales bacterium]|nr:sugar transferase [Acidimicrobiales bacterium]